MVWYLDDDSSIYETTPHVGESGQASNRIMKVAGISPVVTLTTLIKNFVLSVIPPRSIPSTRFPLTVV
jgi:hypothetical protein